MKHLPALALLLSACTLTAADTLDSDPDTAQVEQAFTCPPWALYACPVGTQVGPPCSGDSECGAGQFCGWSFQGGAVGLVCTATRIAHQCCTRDRECAEHLHCADADPFVDLNFARVCTVGEPDGGAFSFDGGG